jgi:peptide methionine sulfoxide reductase msrA/msrB
METTKGLMASLAAAVAMGLVFAAVLRADVKAEVKYEKAIFAGGCFWCVQGPFEKLEGVKEVFAGYTGGTGKDPTYEDYAEKGHVEAVEVTYDPNKITYEKLLYVFWRQIDPTDAGGQFVDRGPQYRSAIFYENQQQKELAEKSKEAIAKSGRFDKPIVTEIVPATKFYNAEDYHQDYYKKNPVRYKYYRYRSGRDQFLEKVWGKEAESH